ncbi:hypothetical protein BJV78DRAFT_440410 [Lactifluus subvellereus]|nr:hypothetical protein BJV78DRAFT_440410 [Lactifluus subvellereus]
MERSSTIFAISSHFYDNPRNRGHYHRAAGTPAPSYDSDARKRHAASTHTWMVEQELAALSKETSETRQWVFEQQVHFGLLPKEGTRRTAKKRPRNVEPVGQEPDEETAWLKERLRTAQRNAERIQLQEEFDRMEARWRERINREERRRRQEHLWTEEQRAREEKEKQLERRRQEEAWKGYERGWTAIQSNGSPLKFKSIPWPTTLPPRDIREITPAVITKFILSPAHSKGIPRKERIKSALRRWHPDRFGRILNRVDERDKGAVERGAGIVARCLNDLLAQEN